MSSLTPPPQSIGLGQIDTIIFDLGDVIFHWTFPPRSAIPPTTIHKIMHSNTWSEYEKGKLTEDECYSIVASEFAVSVYDLHDFARAARVSLHYDPAMLSLLRTLKTRGDLRLFAMSNISLPDWTSLRAAMPKAYWDVFESVFASGRVGERKPEFGFYRHVLERTGADPRRTVFVDDKARNVDAARSFGIHGVVFTCAKDLSSQLAFLLPRSQDHSTAGAVDAAGAHGEKAVGQAFLLNERWSVVRFTPLALVFGVMFRWFMLRMDQLLKAHALQTAPSRSASVR
ncbi:HAD-like domain-containing protein [Daedaleopsis nitida]|nr:HAD-like domain-containing protein [Daedaleopsis nitida]